MEMQVLEAVGTTVVTMHNYRDGDQVLLVDLINETDRVDQFDQQVTVEEIQHRWDDPNFIDDHQSC